jgi:hypothetical protein
MPRPILWLAGTAALSFLSAWLIKLKKGKYESDQGRFEDIVALAIIFFSVGLLVLFLTNKI